MQIGLLGRKLSHSYSPEIHSKLGSYLYKLFEVEPQQLSDFLADPDIHALNVTIPYKKDVIPYCATLTETAKKMGAVNTMIRQPDGSWLGHNTDYFGFQSTVQRTGLNIQSKKALVLGSGGAAGTAVAVLEEMGAKVITISRTGENNYTNLHLHADAALIVNATPVGMYPHTEEAPLSLTGFPMLECVIDMIYNPPRTKLLLEAAALGIPAINGLWMLVAQAVESAEWFSGASIDHGAISRICAAMEGRKENIVLIGMPGCGKSTVARLLSQALNMPIADADHDVQYLAGCSIEQLIRSKGEAYFRELETKVLRGFSTFTGTIIATGGGCVTRAENYPLLCRNGRIFWLQRDLEKLPTDGRPLSQTTPLEHMWKVRQPLYARFADHVIDNNAAPEDAANAIRSLL